MATRRVGPAIRTVATRCSGLWARLEPVRGRVRSRFAVDTRALAAVRIALGLIALVDLVHRSGHVRQFYTDQGAYPVAAYEVTYTGYNGFSIHALSGDLWFQQLLFVLAGLFAVAFVLGYRTRLVGAVSLVLLFSLHARNPAVLNGGDRLFRVLLFVALFTPLGERWSIDALRRSRVRSIDALRRSRARSIDALRRGRAPSGDSVRHGRPRSTVASFGTAALLVQPIVVFVANAILKRQGEHWYAGDALEIALLNDTMSIFLGDVLVAYPDLLAVLNYGWVTLLAGSPVFLLLSVGRVRAVAAIVYLSAFAGMQATMAVGLFPLVLTAAVIPYLTAPFWDALARRVPDRWTDRLPSAARLGPLGRPPVERRLVLALRDRGHRFWAAWVVAFGRTLLTVVGFAVLVWILLVTASDVTTYDVPDAVDYTLLDQHRWGLYAPDPGESYDWYVVAADLDDGSTVDALDGGPVDFDRPPDAATEYESFRHRKFMQSVRNSGWDGTSDVIADSYADWACRQATTIHGDRVVRVTVYRLTQPSPIDGEYEDPRTNTVVVESCSP